MIVQELDTLGRMPSMDLPAGRAPSGTAAARHTALSMEPAVQSVLHVCVWSVQHGASVGRWCTQQRLCCVLHVLETHGSVASGDPGRLA